MATSRKKTDGKCHLGPAYLAVSCGPKERRRGIVQALQWDLLSKEVHPKNQRGKSTPQAAWECVRACDLSSFCSGQGLADWT